MKISEQRQGNIVLNPVGRVAGNPRVLGVDIIFSEPDRPSPGRLARLRGAAVFLA